MKVNKQLLIPIILTIFIILEFFTFFLDAVFFFLCFIVLLYLPFLKISIRRQIQIRAALLFVLGAWFVIWVNEAMNPSYLFLVGMPFLFPQIIHSIVFWEGIPLVILLFAPSFCLLIVFAYILRGTRGTWFFLGASLASIAYAGWSLIEIAGLYYVNVGWALPSINIEGYSFPAVYTFSLFRSIFFATFFTILGHLSNIGILGKITAKFNRGKKREKRLTDFF
jgi:hypothetical protein